MRRLALFLLFGSVGFASDPATLRVHLIDGKFLNFELKNHYQSPVTKFKVSATFGNNFGCSVTADVKTKKDLHPSGICGLPTDIKTGKITEAEWTTRLDYVEFADGMRWTRPSNQSN